jgi:serine/threonine protein kinase
VEYLGKYEIVCELGRGAMGAVYKARDPLIDRLVALKTITAGASSQSNLLERFYQEARSAGTLQHPNIVTIYELGHEKVTPFIAMEYLEGESLDKIIEQRPALPLSVKLGYIVKVCEALAYAHVHNVVHRDVKPANIMVTKEGVVKVVDFGIARLTDMSMTQPNMMIGSRAYMSPQLYKGEKADPRSDIWAMGVTLYELLAYRRPFVGDSEAELMFHIIYETPDEIQSLSPECTEELAQIVNKMLAKRSEDRFESMEDVLHSLEPIWKAAQQATVTGLLADCRELVAAKDLQRAQALLRKALNIDVGNTQAKTLLEKVNSELRRTEILPRVQEHMSRGEGFFKAGQYREAKAEVQAALGLDSKHEAAKKLLAEVEAAETKSQQMEQKLRLTKQRLAEGALTEAAAALGQALEMDARNPQVQELQKQVDDERNRREKRKKLGEILHRARTLWTELNYDECLSVLAAALEEFPNEPELKKLQETAKTDQAEAQKQRRVAAVRKLMAQQNFAEATKALADLLKEFPDDAAVKNLQNLAAQEEQEQTRQKRLETEVAALRSLLGAGKFKQVVAKGEPLLKEFPQEYELTEMLNFAKGEVAQLEQKHKEEEREKQIAGFLMCERYGEALETARKAMQEFPKHDGFRKLAAEAEARKKEQEDRERAREEMKRRVQEINSKINQDKITDAIEMAQETMQTMGPDPNVTQLLQGAEDRRKKREFQEQRFAALQAMVSRGDHAGATRLFDEVMATQIFHANDPRMQEIRGQLASLAGSKRGEGGAQVSPGAKGAGTRTKPSAGGAKEKPLPKPPLAADATQVSGEGEDDAATLISARPLGSPSEVTAALPKVAPKEAPSEKTVAAGNVGRKTEAPVDATAAASAASASSMRPPAKGSVPPDQRPLDASVMPGVSSVPAAAKSRPKPATPTTTGGQNVVALLKQPWVIGCAATAVLLIVIAAVWLRRGTNAAASDTKLKQQAIELWQNKQFDQSDLVWKQLAATKGPLQAEANQQVADIEQKRAADQQGFESGMGLLADKKDCLGAQQAFQAVVDGNAWHAEEAASKLADAKACVAAMDVHKQEQDQFDEGVKLFQANDFDGARKAFRAMLDLNVAGSTLKPQAESYMGKIRQAGSEEKTYTTALQDFKEEKFAESREALADLAKHKGPRSADAKKQLPAVESALNTVNGVETLIKAGSYKTARAQLNTTAQWKTTHDRLAGDLERAEKRQLDSLNGDAQNVASSGDLAGMQRVLDNVHQFQGRAEDPAVLAASSELEKSLNNAYTAALQKSGDKAAFDAAVVRYNQALQAKDAGALGKLIPEFQKIAAGNGSYKAAAAQYATATVPNAVAMLKQTAGKLVVPQLTCGPGKGGTEVPSINGALSCGQLDGSPALQWVGLATVDFPDEAKQPGKLPYTLTVIVTVEPNGKVKVDKDGNPDKAFFNKVKDAAKNWKTTPPMSGGKAVTVRFPLTITFQH